MKHAITGLLYFKISEQFMIWSLMVFMVLVTWLYVLCYIRSRKRNTAIAEFSFSSQNEVEQYDIRWQSSQTEKLNYNFS